MRKAEEINQKDLRAAVVLLNRTEFLPSNITVVGKTKEAIRDEYVNAIDHLSQSQQKKLSQEIKDMYNYLIADEVGEVVAEPAPIVIPETAPSVAPSGRTRRTRPVAEAPAPQVQDPATATVQECQVIGFGWDRTLVECQFCKEKFPEDYKDCSAKVRERKKAEAAERNREATERRQFSRTKALAEALKAGPATMIALAKRSNDMYAEKGGKDSVKEAMWINRFAVSTMVHLGVLVVGEDNVLRFRPEIDAVVKKA